MGRRLIDMPESLYEMKKFVRNVRLYDFVFAINNAVLRYVHIKCNKISSTFVQINFIFFNSSLFIVPEHRNTGVL